jgi:hypothetical protein
MIAVGCKDDMQYGCGHLAFEMRHLPHDDSGGGFSRRRFGYRAFMDGNFVEISMGFPTAGALRRHLNSVGVSRGRRGRIMHRASQIIGIYRSSRLADKWRVRIALCMGDHLVSPSEFHCMDERYYFGQFTMFPLVRPQYNALFEIVLPTMTNVYDAEHPDGAVRRAASFGPKPVTSGTTMHDAPFVENPYIRGDPGRSVTWEPPHIHYPEEDDDDEDDGDLIDLPHLIHGGEAFMADDWAGFDQMDDPYEQSERLLYEARQEGRHDLS